MFKISQKSGSSPIEHLLETLSKVLEDPDLAPNEKRMVIAEGRRELNELLRWGLDGH